MKPFFAPLIRCWPTVVAFASEVGCPERSAREWLRIDSIPAPWFKAVVRAAQERVRRGDSEFSLVTLELLAERAEARRLLLSAAKQSTEAA